jgi:hypothetical protein
MDEQQKREQRQQQYNNVYIDESNSHFDSCYEHIGISFPKNGINSSRAAAV